MESFLKTERKMETCIGPHTYIIFTFLFLSLAYGVYTLEPNSISAKFIASVLAFAGFYIAQKLIPRGRFKPEGKAVFITGCDHGFGNKVAIRCDEIGLRVFAGCLAPGKLVTGENDKRERYRTIDFCRPIT